MYGYESNCILRLHEILRIAKRRWCMLSNNVYQGGHTQLLLLELMLHVHK